MNEDDPYSKDYYYINYREPYYDLYYGDRMMYKDYFDGAARRKREYERRKIHECIHIDVDKGNSRDDIPDTIKPKVEPQKNNNLEPKSLVATAATATPIAPKTSHPTTGEKVAQQKTGTIEDLIQKRLEDKNVNSPLNIKRKQLAENIINLFKDNAYVFGGYLRDEVAGVPFVDLDMYFPTLDLGYDFKSDYSVVQSLRRAGYTIVDLGETKVYNVDPEAKDENGMPKDRFWSGKTRGGKARVRKFEVEDKVHGVTIRFDMVSGTNVVSREDDHPFVVGLDADVNCLWRDKSGGLQVARNMQNRFTVDGIKKNIADRIFIAMEGDVREERITKLTAKGYKSANSSKASKVSKKVTKKESKVMSQDGQTFGEQFKDEMVQAAYQAAGKEVAKGVKAGLIAAAKAHGADDGALAGLAKLLDSEAGEAAISAMLGHALPHAPMVGENEHVQILAEKMRVNGYAQGMSIMFGLMMTFIMPSISKSLEGLELKLAMANNMSKPLGTGKNKIRVAHEADADATTEAEGEGEREGEAPAPARKAAKAA
jgi:hypothetical protein